MMVAVCLLVALEVKWWLLECKKGESRSNGVREAALAGTGRLHNLVYCGAERIGLALSSTHLIYYYVQALPRNSAFFLSS